MVKGIVNGVETYYPGRHYNEEVDGSTTTVKKFYTMGSTTVAVRTVSGTGEVLNWVLGDHLTSTSVTANEDGSWNSELKYTAFGEIRASNGITPTEYRYTNQRYENSLGLYWYRSRWFDNELAHFIQADTLVPGVGDAQAYNRFSYVKYNPILYIDPSGHAELIDDETGVIVRTNKKGNEVIVDGGNLFLTDVRKGAANYILTGDDNYLYSVRGSSIFTGMVFEETSEKLGYDFGTKFRNAFNIFSAAVMGITAFRNPDFSPNYNVPDSVYDDAIGNPDRVGYGYNPQNVKFPKDPSQTGHIFRADKGHFSEGTMENKLTILQTATTEHYQYTDVFGNDIYARINPGGEEIWVQVRNGVIQNAGFNTTPRFIK